jgi:hypothetical protein
MNTRGTKRGYYGYGGRGQRGQRGRGAYSNYNSYAPHNNRQMPGMQLPHGPPGTGMVIPPEMIAELQQKLREKFPDANIPFTAEGMLANMPVTLPVSNMRFKPPMHLVPNSSGYYGDTSKNKKDEVKENKEKEKTEELVEVLFGSSEEEKLISEEEKIHFEELAKMSNEEYLNMRMKLKTQQMLAKINNIKDNLVLNLEDQSASPEKIKQIYKDIFAKMRETVKKMREQMLLSIQERIEENIANVRAEIYHTKRYCELFENKFCGGFDMSKLDPSERKEKVEIPEEFKITDIAEKRDKLEMQKYIESLTPNQRVEKQKNIAICHTYFSDTMASIRHKFGDISKFDELDYLSRKDIDTALEKVMGDFVPVNLFSETRDTLRKGTNPALYSFEWNSNLVNIYQIKEKKSECRVVKFPNGFPLFSRIAMTYEGRVFLTGGYFKELDMFLRTVYEYIEKENKMKRKDNMIFRRSDHSVVCNKGYIYSVGAFVDGRFSNSAEKYDVKNDKWEECDSMVMPRSGVGL